MSTNSTLDLLKQRVSADHFDPGHTLSEEEISELVSYATEAPSPLNTQPWRFIAVTDLEQKQRLKAIANNLQKIADAAVTIVVFGDTQAYLRLPDILGRVRDAGLMDEESVQRWLTKAATTYSDPQLAHDDALMASSLAATLLMVAAEAKGLLTSPVFGTNEIHVKEAFGVPDHFKLVLLLVIGRAVQGNKPRKPRLTVGEVLTFNGM